jgi:hypothetical protein
MISIVIFRSAEQLAALCVQNAGYWIMVYSKLPEIAVKTGNEE